MIFEGIEIATVRPGIPPPDALRKIFGQIQEIQDRKRHLGDVRLPNTVEFASVRMVPLGGSVVAVNPKQKPLNFMAELLVGSLGHEWFQQQLASSGPEHPIITWYRRTMEWQQQHVNADGLVSAKMSGPVKAWFQLAYDVWVLTHHQLLASLLDRLRHKDQFQGARYELMTYALFVRAGYNIEPENERDSADNHVEFFAQRPNTNERIAVEAKSRHRPGVLGYKASGWRQREQDPTKPGITQCLRAALAKDKRMPFVICIDLNLPPSEDDEAAAKKLDVASAEVLALIKEYEDTNRQFPATMVVLTNYPHHYGLPDSLDPFGEDCVIGVGNPAHAFVSAETTEELLTALKSYGNLPRTWEDFD